MTTRPAELIERAKQRLAQSSPAERARFLAWLTLRLSTMARGATTGAGNGEAEASHKLTLYNEMTQVVASQLLAALGAATKIGYPDDAFFNRLTDYARQAEVESDLDWALSDALKRID